MKRRTLLGAAALGLPAVARAAPVLGPGITQTEIKLGQTMPYSGPASAFGTIGKAMTAYFRMINDQGGVNGRKISLLSLDDGYSPPRTVELVKRLVEEDQVFGLVGGLGAPTNAAVQKYLNQKKVPQFFVFSGAARFRDPKISPWTIGIDLPYVASAKGYARYVLANVPDAKIAVIYQNDDFGKDHLAGLRQGLGAKADSLIVKTVTYESTDATVDSQVIDMKGSGANVVMSAALPKFAAQIIRKIHDIGWSPVHLLAYPGASIPGAFQPAGLDASKGVMTAETVKQLGDPAWDNDPDMNGFRDYLKTYASDIAPSDKFGSYGYYGAASAVEVLKRCGDNLTRENFLTQVTHLDKVRVPMLLPGITLNSSPDNYALIRQMRIQRFNGTGWDNVGDVIDTD